MLPTKSDLHVARPLTEMSIAYIQQASDFCHMKMFPPCPVLKQYDRYFKFTKDYWFRTMAAIRADGQESVGTGFHVDNRPTYACDVWAVHSDVGDQLRANVDQPIELDKTFTQFVTQQNLLRREVEFVNRFLKTGVWTGYATSAAPTVPIDFDPGVNGVAKWDATNANPIVDIDVLASKVKSQTGFRPNKLLLGDNVYRAVKNNAQVLDRIKYTQTGIITPDLLAPLFGVDEVVVAEATLNSAAEGQAAQMAYVTGNKFLLAYAAPAPSLMWPSAGYIFTWQGLYGADALGARISNIRIDLKKADRIESEMSWDMNITGSDLGILGINVLTNP